VVYYVVRFGHGQLNFILCATVGKGQPNGILCGEFRERAA
jgi:hypothetical protein